MLRESVLIALMGILLFSCNPNQREPQISELNSCPEFNQDSAFSFIEKQVAFGYRIPTRDGHRKCGDYLVEKLAGYGFDVSEQRDTVLGYDSIQLPLRNIIAKVNPHKKKRILLCAHWDSRPFADLDSERPDEPVQGANDNASGVAVLLELARLFSMSEPSVGVDLVFFDLNDQGRPAFDHHPDPSDHGQCLGSMYWSERASSDSVEFGILLNMVGAPNAQFNLESYSMEYARPFTESIWDLGNQLGFGQFFVYNRTHVVYDDHSRINYMAGIPCVAIVHQDVQNTNLYWSSQHTHDDNISGIDPLSLKAAGQTVAQVIYNQQ